MIANKARIVRNPSPCNESKLHKISETKENKPSVIKQATKKRVMKARIIQTAEPSKQRYTKFVQLRKRNVDRIDIENELKLQNKRRIAMEYDKIRMSKTTIQNLIGNVFKYIICNGNNSEVVRRCMETRHPDWEEISDYSKIFNFKWKPFSNGIRYDQLSLYGQRQLVNHIINHDEITMKDNMFKNLSRYWMENNLDVFQYVPLTFILEYDNDQLIGNLSFF